MWIRLQKVSKRKFIKKLIIKKNIQMVNYITNKTKIYIYMEDIPIMQQFS